MHLTSPGIINGFIADRFGKHATDEDKIATVPVRSLPLVWHDLPENTISLALIMQDFDAVPVCGFSWIHWLVANIDPQTSGLPENASRELSLLQGKNSLASKQICGDMPENLTGYYGGPRPPDSDHEYEFTLYALDCKLDLPTGFRLNHLHKAMRGHILGQTTLTGIYRQ